MSNPDSFIDEVSEELRRDRLFRVFRKYGWIGVVLIIGIVVGTGVVQWRNAQAEARAEAFGDAVLEAYDLGNAADRRAALAAISADGDQAHLLALIEAADPAEDKAATLAALDRMISDASLAPAYRDLAVLRRVLVAGGDMPVAERRASLEPLAEPLRPYSALAREQLAYLMVEEGKAPEAIAALQALIQEQGVSRALQSRAAQMITVLGGTPEAPPVAETATPTAEIDDGFED
ncbi:hypothetical protein Q9295_09555 [Xinfangfangia sp. CPCC 101601]|uniref:Tetratricopeptide repeat-like domain-containing protein n=1 Tax=Pseudogemmobacter lacusdianii TaxID=3069608 RepID=A0ABU0VXY6_9RHOB|nr:hypothetical protein [Xinfangfangia sp. CPCC 101601]MDQ2066620.1 hypothetical protein [Xinfangfangia sp. CPCC 101601]